MKKLFLLLLIALPATLYAQKMGIVDEDIIKDLPQYAQYKAQIENISNRYKAEYDKLQGEMDKKVTEYQAMNLNPGTPENIRLLRIQEIQELNTRIQEFRNAATVDIQQHEQEMLSPLESQLDEAIAAVGREGGYVVIYRKGAVAYVSDSVVDVTSLVKAKLEAEAATETEAEAE